MTTISELAELISLTDLFEGLDEDDLTAIAQKMKLVKFNSQQMIFMRGDEGADFYLVVSGRVRLSIVSNAGRELTLLLADEGKIFGEIAALDGGVRTTDATALITTQAMALRGSDLTRLMEEHPAIMIAVMHFLCNRLRTTDETFEAVAIHSIEVRLARFILTNHFPDDPDLIDQHVAVKINVSQSEIAMLLGASRPKINLAFKALMDSGVLIKRDDGLFCNPSALFEIAEQEIV